MGEKLSNLHFLFGSIKARILDFGMPVDLETKSLAQNSF